MCRVYDLGYRVPKPIFVLGGFFGILFVPEDVAAGIQDVGEALEAGRLGEPGLVPREPNTP